MKMNNSAIRGGLNTRSARPAGCCGDAKLIGKGLLRPSCGMLEESLIHARDARESSLETYRRKAEKTAGCCGRSGWIERS